MFIFAGLIRLVIYAVAPPLTAQQMAMAIYDPITNTITVVDTEPISEPIDAVNYSEGQ